MQYNPLIPEFGCSDFEKSKDFYINFLGFKVEYDRPEDKFCFLSLGPVQLMLEEQNGHWDTGSMEYPYGRGVNFQLNISSITPVLDSLRRHGYPLFREPEERWYRKGEEEVGMREFLVQDPDGYLLVIKETLGVRPLHGPAK